MAPVPAPIDSAPGSPDPGFDPYANDGGMSLAVVVQASREVLITVAGDVDLVTVARMERAAAGYLDGLRPARVTLDLSGVGFFGAAGVSALLRLRDLAAGGGTTLRILPSVAVRRPLLLLELDELLGGD